MDKTGKTGRTGFDTDVISVVQHPDTLFDDAYVREAIDVSGYRSIGGSDTRVAPDETGITARVGGHCLRFESWAPGVVRLRFAPDCAVPPPSTTEELGLIQAGDSGRTFEWSLEGSLLRFSDPFFSVLFETTTAELRIADTEARCLLRSRNGGFRFNGTASDEGRAFLAEFDRADEAYFGFGGRIMRPNRAGTTADIFSIKTGKRSGDYGGFPLPYFISTKGYGLFLNNPWPHVYFDMGHTRADQWFLHAPGGPCDLFIIAGPEFPDIVTRFTAIVGRISTPVRWLLGFWCSSLGFASADQAIADAKRLRAEDYPCDVFVFDGPWRSGKNFISVYSAGHDYPSCDLDWHPDFGNGRAMVRGLAAMGIKTGLHLNSRSFSPETAADGVARGLLRKEGEEVVPRVGDPDAEAYYASLLAPRMAEHIALWWTDHSDRVSGELAPGIPSRNLFGVLWNRLIADLMQDGNGSYPLSLSRGGGIGSQRYALPWPGDTRCGVDALLEDIWFMISAGLSGFPLTSVDLGGFAVRGEPLEDYAGLEERDAEMFSEENIARRLCQAILYVPLPRIHNNWETTAKFPWHCSEKLRPLYRKALRERYHLTPYWFSYALQAAATGQPILRPMVYHHRDDPKAVTCHDQFYAGEWLIVAPGYRQGKERRTVYLPDGAWVNLWTDEVHKGPAEIEVDVPILALEGVAFFVRRGAIIPRQPVTPSLGNELPTKLTFDIYPDGRSRFDLHEAVDQMSSLSCDRRGHEIRVTLENKVAVERRYTTRVHNLDPGVDVTVTGGKEDPALRKYDAGRRLLTVVADVPAGGCLGLALRLSAVGAERQDACRGVEA